MSLTSLCICQIPRVLLEGFALMDHHGVRTSRVCETRESSTHLHRFRYCSGGSCSDLVRHMAASYPLYPQLTYSSPQMKPGVFREEYIAIIVKELLKGLDYLHMEGKLHRDIKGAQASVSPLSTTFKFCQLQPPTFSYPRTVTSNWPISACLVNSLVLCLPKRIRLLVRRIGCRRR